jgi:hypothetical protein
VADAADAAGSPGGLEVTTARHLSCSILAQGEASGIIGRSFPGGRTRLLSAYEMDFILEDVKTLGTRPERLRELLKFLFRGLTELADEEGDWLLTHEERQAIAFLRAELRFLQTVMEPELANLSTKALRASAQLQRRFEKAHVIVFDYQGLSRASQLLCHLLARQSITVIADAQACAEVYDSYPYAEGVEEFCRINPSASTTDLRSEERPELDGIWSWQTPDDECHGLPGKVAELLAGDDAAHGGPASELREDQGSLDAALGLGAHGGPDATAVVCFHPQWFNKILCGLRSRGIAARGLYGHLTLRGDVRNLALCLPLRIVTALRLLADPSDSMAWRCWMGFGDYMAASNDFIELRAQATADDASAVFSAIEAKLEALRQGAGFLASCAALKGRELLEALSIELSVTGEAKVPPVLVPLLGLGDAATPAEMLALLEQRQFFWQFSSTGGVTVASPEALAGLSFDKLIIAGFVNGFFPPGEFFQSNDSTINKQAAIEARERRRLRMLLSTARSKLVLSHFSRVEQKTADRLRLKSDRIIVDDDFVRISVVSMSALSDELI